jgi:hypothetical protein
MSSSIEIQILGCRGPCPSVQNGRQTPRSMVKNWFPMLTATFLGNETLSYIMVSNQDREDDGLSVSTIIAGLSTQQCCRCSCLLQLREPAKDATV